MAGLSRFLDKQVDIEISGNTTFSGTLLDIGQDIIVIHDGRTFLYIPLLHLQRMTLTLPDEENKEPYARKKSASRKTGTFIFLSEYPPAYKRQIYRNICYGRPFHPWVCDKCFK